MSENIKTNNESDIVATTEENGKSETPANASPSENQPAKTTDNTTPVAPASGDTSGYEDLKNPKFLNNNIKGVKIDQKPPEMEIKLQKQPADKTKNKEKWKKGLETIGKIASLTGDFVSTNGMPATPKNRLKTDAYNDKYDRMREAFMAISERQKANIKEADQKSRTTNEQLLSDAKVREQSELISQTSSKALK